MPFVFIHGVSVRNTGDYANDVAVRDELLRRLVIQPLAQSKPLLKDIEIVNPYWGSAGVTFRWDQSSLPHVHFLESLGPEMSGTPQSDIDIANTVQALAGAPPISAMEPLGVSDQSFRAAALKDQARFTEAVLSPIINSEMQLATGETAHENAGTHEALLLIASRDVGQDQQVRTAIQDATSNQQVIEILKSTIE